MHLGWTRAIMFMFACKANMHIGFRPFIVCLYIGICINVCEGDLLNKDKLSSSSSGNHGNHIITIQLIF